MEPRRNLFFILGEWWKARQQAQPVSQVHSDRLHRVLAWLTPNGGTLLLIALLIATQSIWARPFAATNAPGPSATTVNYTDYPLL